MFVHVDSYKAVNSRDMSPRQQRSRVDRVTISCEIREQAIERGSESVHYREDDAYDSMWE